MSDEIEKNNVMNFPSEDMDNLRILEALQIGRAHV